MFAPVNQSIKEKVIAAHLAGFGRNEIDRQLREQGVKVSHGSISNIIKKHKKKHEQSLQPQQPSSLPPQPKAVSNGIDMNYTGFPVIPYVYNLSIM